MKLHSKVRPNAMEAKPVTKSKVDLVLLRCTNGSDFPPQAPSSLSHGLPDASLLRHAIWSRQGGAAAILVDVGAHQGAQPEPNIALLVASSRTRKQLCNNSNVASVKGRQGRYEFQCVMLRLAKKLVQVVLVTIAGLDVDSTKAITPCITFCADVESEASALHGQH